MPVVETVKGWKIIGVPGISPTRKAAEKRLEALKAINNKSTGKWRKM